MPVLYLFSRSVNGTPRVVRMMIICDAITWSIAYNGTVRFKNVNNCLNTNIYSYPETGGDQSYHLYLDAVHFFNTSVN